MILIIGGYAQGKLHYVCERYDVKEDMIWDAELPDETENGEGSIVINHLHQWIKLRMRQESCPEEEIMQWLEKHPDSILISNEIGNGIVPIEEAEREYREQTGRILIKLASMADRVERVICGIGQRIK